MRFIPINTPTCIVSPISAMAWMPPLVALASEQPLLVTDHAMPLDVQKEVFKHAEDNCDLFVRIPSSLLKSYSGFGKLDDLLLFNDTVRLVKQGSVHEGADIGGYAVVVDGASFIPFINPAYAREHLRDKKKQNKTLAPSLKYIKNQRVSE